jgi:hypothetical protein
MHVGPGSFFTRHMLSSIEHDRLRPKTVERGPYLSESPHGEVDNNWDELRGASQKVPRRREAMARVRNRNRHPNHPGQQGPLYGSHIAQPLAAQGRWCAGYQPLEWSTVVVHSAPRRPPRLFAKSTAGQWFLMRGFESWHDS